MSRTFAEVMLSFLAALVLLAPGKAVAGPPEGASGKMVFDEVADGLRKYRKEMDPEKRLQWLKKLARTHDPRVAVALWEYHENHDREDNDLSLQSITLLTHHFVTGNHYKVGDWWKANDADIRRRAKQLPQ